MMHALQIAIALCAICACAGKNESMTEDTGIPQESREGKTAIVAHRGFWNCEEAGYSENTIAALKAAQDAGFWGSEFDIHLAGDGTVVVNHDNTVFGRNIWNTTYEELSTGRFRNGETIPTLDAFLAQAEKSASTVLVCEFKEQANDSRNDLLVERAVELLKAHNLFHPDRVAFISFSLHVCRKIATEYPEFTNQYLRGDLSPEKLKEYGINGLDYQFMILKASDFTSRAHEIGLEVNAWTVNGRKDIEEMIEQGVDAITTNEPLLVRELLGGKEYILQKK